MEKMTMKQMLAWGASLIFLVLALISVPQLVENVAADEVVVIQSVGGDLNVYSQAGPVWQGFGRVTSYKKREQYSFSAKVDQGKPKDESIDVTFNDGGHGKISGVNSWEMPTSVPAVVKLHTLFGSQNAIEQQLVRPAIEKAVYLTGPMMSSTESYQSRRSEFLQIFEDQSRNGIYKTETFSDKQLDPVSGKEKTVNSVRIVMKDGVPVRQSASALKEFGIVLESPSIEIIYDKTILKQIEDQQKAVAQIQTAQAEARGAEQKAITTVKQGEAEAAKKKWEQEALKATAVTKAEQEKAVAITDAEKERDVAKLKKDAADFYKQEQILKGEGDGAYRQKVMQANGALEQKLETYSSVMINFAREFGKQKWVPEVQMGGTGASGVNSVSSMMDMLSAKTARDLGLDMKMSAGKSEAPAEAVKPAKK